MNLTKKTTPELQESILNQLPNYFIFWKDTEGKYLGCNHAFAKLAGQKTPEELIGKCDYDYWSKDESTSYVADDNQVMKTLKPKLNIEEQQTTPWGERIILYTSKAPLIDEKGEVYGILGISCDVTQEKLIEENVRETNLKLENICEAFTEIVSAVNPDIQAHLSEILQNSQIISENITPNAKTLHSINTINNAAQEIKKSLEKITSAINL